MELFGRERKVPPQKRWLYQEFRDAKLHYTYITDAEKGRAAMEQILAFAPQQVAVDFETHEDIRLVQLGFDVPGFKAKQLVFDCHTVPVELFRKLFRDANVEKLVHYSQFEQSWCVKRLGVTMDNVYDTCIAWQVIQKRLGELHKQGGDDLVGEYVPGWSKHPNKLTTICERVLGFPLPKEEQASNWAAYKLTKSQLDYAALDVAVLPVVTERTRLVSQALDVESTIIERAQAVAQRLEG